MRGPNVMAGYLLADQPGVVVPPEGGWHDTGDIVTIDDGYVTIRGRAKRFAKLGGEMVSLAAVESLACGLWSDAQHVVLSLPDPRKGEQLVLVTDKPDAEQGGACSRTPARRAFPSCGCRRPCSSCRPCRCSPPARSTCRRPHEMARQARPAACDIVGRPRNAAKSRSRA